MRSKTRTDQDSMGPVRLPRHALYGAQTGRAIENFPISGRTADPALIRAYLRLKLAAARTNAAAGVLSRREAALIVQAATKLLGQREREWRAAFPVDPYQAGAGTSLNMNVNEVLANVANRAAGRGLGRNEPIHPNDHVNRSQSTNDTFPTAMRLALLESSRGLERELTALGASFRRKGRAWMEIPKAARTHLQDAVPMRLGQEFNGYAASLARLAGLVDFARDGLRELGIGGSAAGTGLNVPPGYRAAILRELARLTGERRLRGSADLREAMQSQAPVMVYSSMLRVAALELTRICNDLRLLASGPVTGLAELTLPAVQPGSSIMPGKVNPSILEMANQAWFSVLGYDQAVAYAMQAGQLELNVMMPIMAYSLLEATGVATRAAAILREKCIEGLKPNPARLRRYYEGTSQISTALTPLLGYDATAKLVKESLETGRSVIELVRERRLVDERRLKRLLALRNLTGPASR